MTSVSQEPRRYRLFGVLAALALLVFAVIWWPGRTYYGYCHAEGRYLSDAEKIDAAVTEALASYPPTLATYRIENGEKKVADIRRPANPVPYASKEEFLRANPHCCALTASVREGQSVTFLSRLTGSISTFVTVRYQVRYRNETGAIVEEPSETFSAISNCGHAWSGH